MRPGLMAGIAGGLLLIGVIIAGRLMVGLTTPMINAAPLQQSTPTNTPVPAILLSPSSAVANQTITLSGANFTSPNTPGGAGAGGVHQITGNGASLVTLDGQPLDPPLVDYPVDLYGGGNLLVTVVLPTTTTTITSGNLDMTVTDSFGQSATATLTIPKRSLTITPDEGPRGSLITVGGSGFPASNPRTAARSVSLTYGGIPVGSAATDAAGGFSTTFTVPLTVDISSTNTIAATGSGTTGTATVNHKVPSPTLTLTPSQAAAGDTIGISGSGFLGFSTVTTVNIGNLSVLPYPIPTVPADGSLSLSVLVPQMNLGAQVVRLIVGGHSVSATFTIVEGAPTPTPLPTAAPSPVVETATALEPLAENLVRVWSFDNATKGWSYYDPRPVFASTATVTQLVRGRIYWIKLNDAQTVTLNGEERTMYVGWNLLAW